MSWQGYVDVSLVGSQKIDKAAIFSAAGDSVWAVSKGFAAQPEEIKYILNGFTNHDPLYANGLHVDGEKYVCIKADDRSIYGKLGKKGICCVKTKQAILVAHYPENVLAAEAAKIVESLADYLIGMGY